MDRVIVGIAEGKIVCGEQELISYALGSCVGICLYERKRKIAGMAHIVLPNKSHAIHWENPYKFADQGVKELIRQMVCRGADKGLLIAKIAGGARMFQTNGQWEIGEQNVKAVKKALKEEGIELVAEDTGKNYGRTLIFSAESGVLEVKTVRHALVVL